MKGIGFILIALLIVALNSCDFKKSDNNIKSQNNSTMKCIQYIPETESYKIYVPESFDISESEDNILTIKPKDISNNPEIMTITSYATDVIADIEFITNFLNSITEKYTRIEEIKEINTSNAICVRGVYTKENLNWIWICKAKGQRILIISIHKETGFNQELMSLYSFIIDNIEIL